MTQAVTQQAAAAACLLQVLHRVHQVVRRRHRIPRAWKFREGTPAPRSVRPSAEDVLPVHRYGGRPMRTRGEPRRRAEAGAGAQVGVVASFSRVASLVPSLSRARRARTTASTFGYPPSRRPSAENRALDPTALILGRLLSTPPHGARHAPPPLIDGRLVRIRPHVRASRPSRRLRWRCR